jgi:hypothetical protein
MLIVDTNRCCDHEAAFGSGQGFGLTRGTGSTIEDEYTVHTTQAVAPRTARGRGQTNESRGRISEVPQKDKH